MVCLAGRKKPHGIRARPMYRRVELSPLPRWLDRENRGRQRACAKLADTCFIGLTMDNSSESGEGDQRERVLDTGTSVNTAERSAQAQDDAGTMGVQALLEELHLQDEKALREEFMRLQDERDSLEDQYQTLLSKVSQMRTTLGERLRQDAVGGFLLTGRRNWTDENSRLKGSQSKWVSRRRQRPRSSRS